MADNTINYDRPTLATLIARARADMAGKVSNSLAYISGSLEFVLSGAHAGAASLMYGAIDQIYRNILADRATGTWLDRIASRYEGLTRITAYPSAGTVTFTWTAGGQNIPANTVLTDAAGAEYETSALLVDPGAAYPNTATVAVVSLYTGAAANIASGTTLTITTPIAGITSEGVAATTFAGGGDEETDASLSARVVARQRNTPQGGAEADYEVWAKASSSAVDSVWVVQEVATLPYITVIYTGSTASGTVKAYVDARAPLDAIPEYGSVDNNAAYRYGVTLDITSHSLAGYADPDVEDNIEAAVRELFDQEGGPEVTTIKNSKLRNAIGDSVGLDYFTLDDVNADGTGLSDLTSGAATVHYLTTINYTWIP